MPDEKFKGKSKAGMYGDFVSHTDAAIGQVLQTLEQLSLRDNTLVFFISDNGPVWYGPDVEKFGHSATYFLKGMKADTWEGGHCMPFIARWAG